MASLPAPRPFKHGRRGSLGTSHFVTVREGDTLSTLAARHGTTATALRRINGLASNQIRPGQRLKLRA